MGLASFPGNVGPCAAYVLLELYGGSGDWGGASFEGAVDGKVLIDGRRGCGGGGESSGLLGDDVNVDGGAQRLDVSTVAIEGGVVQAFPSCVPTSRERKSAFRVCGNRRVVGAIEVRLNMPDLDRFAGLGHTEIAGKGDVLTDPGVRV